MSAEIIQFIQTPKPQGKLLKFGSPGRSIIRADDLAMGHGDTVVPCEHIFSGKQRSGRADRN